MQGVARVEVAVLGPLQLRLDGVEVDLGTPKQRALVAALALSRGRPVAVDTLADLLWGDAPPPGMTASLQAYVSGLRRVIEPHRPPREPASVLVTVAPGYALRVPDNRQDAWRFERTVVDRQRQLREPGSLGVEALGEAVAALELALASWRGTPYGELGDAPAAAAERTRLEELQLVALETQAVGELALGHHGTVAAELEALTARHPLRERLWALRALALTRAGRQADALEVLRTVRELLADELGIEPGAELRQLQTAVLRQDPALDWVPPRDDRDPVARSAQSTATRRPQLDDEAAPPALGPPVVPAAAAAAPWPMAGREADLAALLAALTEARGGRPSHAVVTGEPGIGKSRLCAELAARAREAGVRVVVSRCSQDDGAPPLWPWATALEALGEDLDGWAPGSWAPGGDPDDDPGDAGRFRAWEQITRRVRQAARRQPLLLVLDDLHWADPSTLRVLRLLVETATDEPLLVVCTWRSHPAPTGALSDVAETLARRHATRVSLAGLTSEAVAVVFEGVAHRRPDHDQADALRERTDGNPFFLVEYARLAGERTDVAELVADAHPPAGVHEVLTRRLAQLPGETVTLLRTAAVVGRRFDAPTLARAAALDPDDLLDLVEPAQAAGLVREDGVDRFVFAHALVRDTVVGSLSASRRARVHARVAEALAGQPGRDTEEARHWLAAGPAQAHRAWRAAVTAAEVARRVFAHEEGADLLRAALASMAEDPGATVRQRYDVLMALVDAYRWSARWPQLVATAEEAVSTAQQLADPALVARAALSPTQGTLWQSAPPGEVNPTMVDALRTSLDQLPTEDSPLRCRTMLGLGNELYWRSSTAERRALVDEGLAMARRLGDDALLLDACQIAFVTLWSPGTAEERLVLVDEAVRLARAAGDGERSLGVATTLRAVVLSELGRPDEMGEAVDVARRECERLRLLFGILILDSLVLPWEAMAGRFAECEALVERIGRIDRQIAVEPSEDATASARAVLDLWRGAGGDAAVALAEMEGGPLPVTALVVAALWRGDQEDAARRHEHEHPLDVDALDGPGGVTWFSLLAWCHTAEAALHLDRPTLAAAVYDRLAPYAGRTACAGSANATGPVDAFLALAAAAAGETGLAAAHADQAERLCERWRIPLAGRWLREQRDRYAF